MVESRYIKLSQIELNKGQIAGLPKNPRILKDGKFQKLVNSIEENPEMLELRELLVYEHEGKFVLIGGNMRFRALKHLKVKEAPCKIIPAETTIEQLKAYVIKDNAGFGDWDFELLANEWDEIMLSECGIDLPALQIDEESDNEESEEETDDELQSRQIEDITVRDVIYDSDNDFEIPNLLLDMQAGRLELPLSPWGANSRLNNNITTYHFYVDDYRFNKLFKDPTNLICSGCRAIVEPNCSLHDQMPIAYGLHRIYQKRWIARYCQECGILVYADLNVAEKFRAYNRLGIPKGYNAFMTRGITDSVALLANDLQEAREISGLERPNLLVYGGGKDIKEFCKKNNLLYVQDYINDKEIY